MRISYDYEIIQPYNNNQNKKSADLKASKSASLTTSSNLQGCQSSDLDPFRSAGLYIPMYSTKTLYSARNLEMSNRFSLKSRPSERFHRPEMSQIKAEISLRTNVKLIFHNNVGLQ